MQDEKDEKGGVKREKIEILEVGAQQSQAVPPEERVTTRYMTKYERARVLGTRALQIRYSLCVL